MRPTESGDSGFPKLSHKLEKVPPPPAAEIGGHHPMLYGIRLARASSIPDSITDRATEIARDLSSARLSFEPSSASEIETANKVRLFKRLCRLALDLRSGEVTAQDSENLCKELQRRFTQE